MSDTGTRRRIRAQSSAGDPDAMGFILDAPIQGNASVQFEAAGDAPLARALFALDGIERVEVSGATIWAKKHTKSDWATLKPAIADAIRKLLDETDAPLGQDEREETTPDQALLEAVKTLLNQQVNPAVAAHGGQISVDRVEDSAVYLRMSGGCQGCAASAATLREGVERMLRAALPQIKKIIDVTDHAAGDNPFYARDDGSSPILNRPVPEGVIGWEDGQIIVDPDYLAPKLGITPEALRAGLQRGDVVGVTETGEGQDSGKTRIVLRTTTRAWAAEIDASGAAREIPPPRLIETAAGKEKELATRVRAHLQGLAEDEVPITYGALARALGLWAPGSIAKVTRALETTMREDAVADRAFIAARAVNRGSNKLPGKGYFDLARALSRGPRHDESELDYHVRELRRLNETMAK
ncbi:MAG: NifU family protein [Roseovarius sp.]|nr:NifU family protein [Roseovarius sp.]